MENYFKERNINFSMEFEPSIPPILAVSSQITQVLFNTLMNAVESMPDGGDLSIRIKLIDKTIKIDIMDTGAGMKKKSYKTFLNHFIQQS